jgi:murein DD-endopeptidase MepM/ murein hydrolase activator NlpD
MRGERLARRYLFFVRGSKSLVYRLLAAAAIFGLAWLLALAGGPLGQLARDGIAYVSGVNYDLQKIDLSPVIDRVGILLGVRKGLDVQVDNPIPRGSDDARLPDLPATGKLVRGFGWQKDRDGWPRFSNGVELEVAGGAPVRAVLPGKVSRVFQDASLGTVVVVQHEGQVASLYGRLDAVGVQQDQQVEQGQVLATAAGAYLHFEMRDGDQLVDPVQRLQQKQQI